MESPTLLDLPNSRNTRDSGTGASSFDFIDGDGMKQECVSRRAPYEIEIGHRFSPEIHCLVG